MDSPQLSRKRQGQLGGGGRRGWQVVDAGRQDGEAAAQRYARLRWRRRVLAGWLAGWLAELWLSGADGLLRLALLAEPAATELRGQSALRECVLAAACCQLPAAAVTARAVGVFAARRVCLRGKKLEAKQQGRKGKKGERAQRPGGLSCSLPFDSTDSFSHFEFTEGKKKLCGQLSPEAMHTASRSGASLNTLVRLALYSPFTDHTPAAFPKFVCAVSQSQSPAKTRRKRRPHRSARQSTQRRARASLAVNRRFNTWTRARPATPCKAHKHALLLFHPLLQFDHPLPTLGIAPNT